MAVPKKRTSRRVRDQRRAHDFLVATAAVEACPSCGQPKQRHHVCPSCGTYRGRKVFSDNDEAVASAE
jgi:large subunit ribosomal protein L32